MKEDKEETKARTTMNVSICLALAALVTMLWLVSEERDGAALVLGAGSILASVVAFYYGWMIKQLKESQPSRGPFYGDQQAVSPVIAVILMVAITVVLAATVFVLVADIGSHTPNATITMAWSQDNADKSLMVSSVEVGHKWNEFQVNGCTRPDGNETVDPGDKLTACSGDVTVVYLPGNSLVYSTKF